MLYVVTWWRNTASVFWYTSPVFWFRLWLEFWSQLAYSILTSLIRRHGTNYFIFGGNSLYINHNLFEKRCVLCSLVRLLLPARTNVNKKGGLDRYVYMMTSSNGSIFRVTGPFCGEFTGHRSAQSPVTRSFDVFFDLRLNKRLSKQSWGWWFETPSHPLWRHCNVLWNVRRIVIIKIQIAGAIQLIFWLLPWLLKSSVLNALAEHINKII